MTPVAILYFLNRYVTLPSVIAWGGRGVQSWTLNKFANFFTFTFSSKRHWQKEVHAK